MPKYEVTLEMIVYCPVKIVVEADDKDAAIDAASGLIAGNVYSAHHDKSRGWKAMVDIAPPKGVEVVSRKVRASIVSQTSGGEKAKKLAAAGQ